MGASTLKREAGEVLEQRVKGVTFSLRTRGLLCRHKYTISKNCTVIGAIRLQNRDMITHQIRTGKGIEQITFATALASSG
jgi:hypothetical protein